jgi:hypothetical protein
MVDFEFLGDGYVSAKGFLKLNKFQFADESHKPSSNPEKV